MSVKERSYFIALTLFSLVPGFLLYSYFADADGYINSVGEEGYLGIPKSLRIFSSVGKIIFLSDVLYVVIAFMLCALVVVSLSNSVAFRLQEKLKAVSPYLYFTLFSLAFASFVKAIYEIATNQSFAFGFDYLTIDFLLNSGTSNAYLAIKVLVILLVACALIETILRASKISTLRKYFNGLFFIFGAIAWFFYDPNSRMSEFSFDKLIFDAAFFYLTSLSLLFFEKLSSWKTAAGTLFSKAS